VRKLSREDLMALETYAVERDAFRERVMAHKADRRLDIGEHLSLYFEDRLIMQYQVQEMLRTERIFDPQGIQEELDAYNPLIPDGRNLKATMMILYPDAAERQRRLRELVGIEDRVWLQVAGFARVLPICDEDLPREDGEKTSAVHFARFEFGDDMVAALREGAALSAGADHPGYSVSVSPVEPRIAAALCEDFD